jgi:hypothetical protein
VAIGKTYQKFGPRPSGPYGLRLRRAQAMAEFALLMPVAIFVLFVSVQFALLGTAYLALGQMNDQGARYAAVHWDCGQASCTGGGQSVRSYMISVGSPIITQSGGSNLNITVSPAAPRTRGQTVTVSVTYTIPSSVIFLPNPFLGIRFPTSFSDSKSAFSEGS